MNLNISMQIINNFQGNNVDTKVELSNIGFESILVEANIDTKENDINAGVYENLIQFIISGLKNDENVFYLSDKEKYELEDILDRLNTDNIYSEGVENPIDIKNKLIETKYINEDSSKLISLFDNISEKEDMNILERSLNNNEKDKLEQFIKSRDEYIKLQSNEKGVYSENKLQNGFEIKSNKENIYEELEINSFCSMKKIVDNSNKDVSAKELDLLENMINKDESVTFTTSNNNLARIDINSEIDNTQNIKEIRQEFVSQDIVKTVKYMNANGLEEITVKVSPKELGEITIKIIKSAEDSQLVITISKEEVFDLVNKNILDISKHLNEFNIKAKDVLIEMKTNNEDNFSQNLNQEFKRDNSQNKNKKNKYESIHIEDIENVAEEDEYENLNILI